MAWVTRNIIIQYFTPFTVPASLYFTWFDTLLILNSINNYLCRPVDKISVHRNKIEEKFIMF